MRVQLTTHVYVNQKNANKTYKNCMQLQIKNFMSKNFMCMHKLETSASLGMYELVLLFFDC